MVVGKAFVKLLEMDNLEHLIVNNWEVMVIPDGEFSKEEIEELRMIDRMRAKRRQDPWFANFLPDDIRPPGVKKL